MTTGRDRNWIVPVTVKGRYWSTLFYAPGYPTPREAEQSIRQTLDELPDTLETTSAHHFVVGMAEETPR